VREAGGLRPQNRKDDKGAILCEADQSIATGRTFRTRSSLKGEANKSEGGNLIIKSIIKWIDNNYKKIIALGLILFTIGLIWNLYFLIEEQNIEFVNPHLVSFDGLLLIGIFTITFGIGISLNSLYFEAKDRDKNRIYSVFLLIGFLISIIFKIIAVFIRLWFYQLIYDHKSIPDGLREAFKYINHLNAVSFFGLFIMLIIIFILINFISKSKKD
jgi:hypothetical protein